MFIRYNDNKNYNSTNRPIICPNCDKRNIAILTEYHKAFVCRIVEVIMIAIIFWLGFEKIEASIQGASFNTGAFLPLLIIALIFIEIARHYIESKTNIQCVCKDCGWVWIHDCLY